MSAAESIDLDSDETPVTEPPRIPLRIWHWFVWSFATMALMAIINVRDVETVDSAGWMQVFHMVVWSAQAGLVLTACLALARVLRRRDLPRELRWCPGHFLIGMSLLSAVVSIALFIAISFVSYSSGVTSLITIINLSSLALMVAIAALALYSAASRRWRLYFAAWIVASVLQGLSSYLFGFFFAGSNLNSFQNIAILLISADAICLVLLGYAAAVDGLRPPLPVYARTWTHWAGAIVTAISFVTQIAWYAFTMLNPPW